MGGVLSQLGDYGKRHIIHVFSKPLDSAQRNYSIMEKGLPAAVNSIDHSGHYLIEK